nr:winged helix-turn-helix domain-containing protein [Nocardia sp. 348MFTsu5.1]
MSQSAIGAILGISQAQVNRRLRQLRRTPELLDQTPADVLNERAVDLITTDEMMQQLRTWPFTFGSVPAVHGDATDTYVRGPWDDVEAAYHQKLLSDNEMQELLAVHRLKIGVPAVGR